MYMYMQYLKVKEALLTLNSDEIKFLPIFLLSDQWFKNVNGGK